MRIIRAVESIPVEHPIFCWFGQPGIGKTSLGYSTKDPLLLDFDAGAHRAANRRDTLQITTWADVAELMENPSALEPYATVVVDTVGRCLDLMTADILASSPRLGQSGNLTQQGWGVLKTRFRTWTAQLRALGKDVALIAHDKEDRDGDIRIVRPDIVGGSYSEVMKVSDFCGYAYMNGRNRILDFNPTDRWVGKNPGGWKPFEIPPVGKATDFMATLFQMGREALGTISDTSAKITTQVEEWRTAINAYTLPEEINRAIPQVKAITPTIAQEQVRKLLGDRAKALQFVWSQATNSYKASDARPQAVGA